MARGYKTLPIEDFSGGWNPRDANSQVADNESPRCLNVTLDDRGGVFKRLGYGLTNNRPTTLNAQTMYYSKALDLLLCQEGAQLYKSADFGDTWSSIKTFTTSDTCAMVDFLGKLVVVHPVDTCFTYDGATFSGAVANSPKGNAIAVWQNYLWTCGDPTSAITLTRVTRSNAGDTGGPVWPASPTYVDLRYKDDEPLTAIGGGVGMDEAGRGGLLVFKHRSMYRIHDSASLANTIVDYSYGAGGPRAIATMGGITAAISEQGIVVSRGDYGRADLVSQKLEPLFRPGVLKWGTEARMCASPYQDRLFFSLTRSPAVPNANNLTLEFHPTDGWIVPHGFGSTCFAHIQEVNVEKLIGGFPGDSTPTDTRGYIQDHFTQATDEGVNVEAYWQSRWFAPFGANSVRFRRCIVNGRGTCTMRVKLNYDTGNGVTHDLDIDGSGAVWGTDTWGTDTTGTGLLQSTQELHSLGHGRAIAFEIYDNSSATITIPELLPSATQETRGAFLLYGLTLDMVPLGAS